VKLYREPLGRDRQRFTTHLRELPHGRTPVVCVDFSLGHDHRSPDGTPVAGYETLIMNINVVLLFVFAILAAHRSGSSWRGTILFGSINAALGWLIITVELALE
jgi:hypothetical protein